MTALGPAPRPRPPALRRSVGLAVATLALAGLVPAGAPASAAARTEAPPPVAATALAPSGSTVTFGIRPAGEKNVDQRALWDYKDQTPGRTFIDHVGVVNLSDHPVTLDVYPADAYNNADGGLDVYTPSTPSKDLGSWISLTRTKVAVPARATVIMPFVVKIPANAQPGDHTAGIVASFLAPGKDAKGNAIQLNSRVGQRVYLRVRGPLRPAVAVEGLSAGYRAGGPFGKGTSNVRFSVHNTGNVRVSGTPNLRVGGLFSDADVRSLPAMPDLLPGNSVTLSGTAKGLFPLDRDSAEVRVEPKSAVSEADPQLSPVVQSVGFWAVSWPLLGVVLVVVGAASWWGVGWWRRRRPARPGPTDGDRHDSDDGDDLGGSGSPVGVQVPPGHHLVDLRDLDTEGVGVPGVAPRVRTVDRRRAPGGVRAALRRHGVVLALTLGAMGGVAGTAHAEDTGTLTFLPARGSAITPLYAVTSAPCPTPTVAFVGFVSGGAFPPDSVAVSLNTSTAVRRDRAFGIPLSNSLKMLAQNNGVALTPGKYTITVQCTDLNTVTIYRTFTGSVTVGENLEVTGVAPSAPPDSGIPLTVLANAYPEVKASLQAEAPTQGDATSPGVGASAGAAGGASPGAKPAATPGAPGAAAPVLGGPNEGQQTSGTSAGETAAAGGGGSSLPVVIVVGVGMIAALVALRWFAARRQAAALEVGDEAADWSQLEDDLDGDVVIGSDGEDTEDDAVDVTVDAGDRNDR